MKQPLKTKVSRPALWARGHWPDRNPLRRPTDRAEAALIGLLAVAFITLTPIAVLLIGHWSSAPPAPAAAAKYKVRAVLTGSAPAPTRYSGLASFTAPARWVSPGGIRRTGEVAVDAGARAGSTVLIWVDKLGRQVTSIAGSGGQLIALRLIAAVGAAAFVFLAGQLSRKFLHWRRMAAWDADWLVTEPRWSSRR